MKKNLLVLLLAVMIVPSVAFASWWNPFSWNVWNKLFDKKETITVDQQVVDDIIENKVEEKVNNILKEKEDEKAVLDKQRIDEQKKIGASVKEALDKQKEETPSPLNEELSKNELKKSIDESLNSLMVLHYITVPRVNSGNPDTFIFEELQEAMDNANKLKGIFYKSEELSKSNNQTISTTGLVINIATIQLIKNYTAWIEYLRTVDITNLDISEYQYQYSFFQSSSHDSYLNLVQGASFLPYVTIKFPKDGVGRNTFDEELRTYFVLEINKKFSNILIENEDFYKKTKKRYAVATLINKYKDFFNGNN